ncbi:transcriptional-regulating factor 1-like isoform X2 [Perca fluviatilis]|uniref:transcriptional-regulating factor 1-like isoform X2 n=1 Tax=Perca fluviatilis TaxID=8168 RepID=UPI001965E685|nr:transcriptional-regulating factor 1-like isoform X2 [Perca fluviatilis]
MSDLWPFPSSCSPPIMHHSSPPIMHHSSHPQPPPPLSSPHLLPRPQVSSPHIPFLSSQKHFSYPHVTPPPSVPQTQLPTPQNLPNTPANCPHSVPQNQLSSCQNFPSSPLNSALIFPPPQDRSPHFSPPQGPFYNLSYPHFTPPPSVPQTQLPTLQNLPNTPVNSPQNLRYTPVNSPQNLRYTHVNSPQNVRYSPVNSSLDFPSPQLSPPPLLSPSQHQLCFQNPNPTSDNPDWIRSELPYSYSYQNQTIVHLDVQNQNQFSTGVSHHGDEMENTHHHTHLANNHHTHLANNHHTHQANNHHTHLTSGVYGQDQGAWRPTLSQLRCSPLGSGTGNVTPGCWSSADFNNQSPAEDFSGSQFFFHDSYHDNYASQQPFCSPTTPGPSPHYPQTPAVCSPGSQMHPSQERMEFPAQPSRQTLSCCFHDYDGYPVTSDPAQTTNQGQDVTGAARAPSLAAGPSLRDESGGGEDTQKEFKMKQPENISRLLCTVCKRDFRSLPALNGHMRCHSASRPATCLNKSEDSSAPVQPCVSIVMPVSVPVQSRGRPKACRGGQKRCSRPSPATGGAVLLYRSLLHPEEEEARDGVVAGIHYTPPPMLCPLRAGPGLYCSLATGRQQRVQTVQLHNAHDGFNDGVAMETASPPSETLTNKPRINEGRDFQAEIPALRDRKHAASDSHNALLVWTQWDELERPVNQHRVEALLTMARSSVLPGGGTSPETALHILSEFRGDFLLTVEKLLTPQTSKNSSAPQSLREKWSAAEKRLLVKSLQLHHKDFSRIQRNVQTKSLSQCVEFYYLWKKKLSLSARTPARLTVTLPETDGRRSSRSPDAS